ncbi:MAG: DUF2330 domain-containing protein, partial [Sandaracinaceae bacterium]|nr:DUF2330 domain-containing protein [Sandaracinaceae bacterium]
MARTLTTLTLLASLLAGLALTPTRARAFCGFYVAGSETSLHNHASTVVLMREGHRTILSMQNDYAGPPEDFAMVVPVPAVLERDDVRTLDRELFARIERLTGPRLVEYWEEDPCAPESIGLGTLGLMGFGGSGGMGSGFGGGGSGFVHVEAQFSVAEYDVVILGTDDSSALEAWLREHQYRIPDGAAEALRPYVEAGMKFFVARVDARRVRFEAGHAVLSPLRVQYESPELSLPVRLGLLNSAGAQDLVVLVLARNQRFEVANYPNVFVPTNLDVSADVRDDFGAFYDTLLDRTFERHPGSVVAEYSWQASSCDPCPPDATLDGQMLTSLGGDVLYTHGVQRASAGIGLGAGAPSVRMDPVTVSGGGLSSEVVRRVMRRHINEIRFCYEQELASIPTMSGIAELTFTISEEGTVSEAEVTLPSPGLSPRVVGCIRLALRRWSFPSAEGGVAHAHAAVTLTSGLTGTNEPIAYANEFVVTRLHYRYERGGLGEDLVFRTAPPVAGGREVRNDAGALEETAPGYVNNFQARYAIRHAWQGAITCEHPVRGRWGGRPLGADPNAPFTGAAPTIAPAHAAPRVGAARSALAIEPLVLAPVVDLGRSGRATASPPSTSATP